MAATCETRPPVVVDTREQRPYLFADSVRGTLRTGDYSLLGYEDRILHLSVFGKENRQEGRGSGGTLRRASFRREMLF